MQIDWFTFGAQIINFLILVMLLRRFLYKPIIQVMEKREQRILAQTEEAERKQQQAEQDAASLRKKHQEIEAQRADLLAQAEEEAQERHQAMLKQVHAEIEEIRSEWQEVIRREKDAFLHDLRQRVGEQIFQVTRRALADLADVELEQHIVAVFASRLHAMAPDALSDSLHDPQETVIYSVFELSSESRSHLSQVVRQQIGDHLVVRFETEPQLIGGVLMKINGYQLGWNLRDYLRAMEERLAEALEASPVETGPPGMKVGDSVVPDTAREPVE